MEVVEGENRLTILLLLLAHRHKVATEQISGSLTQMARYNKNNLHIIHNI